MLRVGLAGIGFMGRIHFLAYQGVQGAHVAAIASRDQVKLAGDWSQTPGNFGPPPGRVDLSGIRTYREYKDLLSDESIDLIDICSPNHLHPSMAIAALEAGKHVLVEKAIALTVADADRMLAAAKQSGKALFVAHVLPFFPEFAYAAEAVRSGRYGRLQAAHFKRIIAMPSWSDDFAAADKSGGPAVDLHIHDTHFIGLLAGVPTQVESFGCESQGSVTYLSTNYRYPPGGPIITANSGAIAAAARQFVHGFELYLEHATLSHDSGGIPLTIFHQNGTTEHPTLPGQGDPIAAFTSELQEAVDAILQQRESPLLSAQLARDALAMCLNECDSVKLGRPVNVG